MSSTVRRVREYNRVRLKGFFISTVFPLGGPTMCYEYMLP